MYKGRLMVSAACVVFLAAGWAGAASVVVDFDNVSTTLSWTANGVTVHYGEFGTDGGSGMLDGLLFTGDWEAMPYVDYNAGYRNSRMAVDAVTNSLRTAVAGDIFAYGGSPGTIISSSGDPFKLESLWLGNWLGTGGGTQSLTLTPYLGSTRVAEAETFYFDSAQQMQEFVPTWHNVIVDKVTYSNQGYWAVDNLTYAPVPEPISMVMLGCLGGGMALARKLRRKSA